jgi:hypothetical protein
VWTRYARVYRSAVVGDPITHRRKTSELGRSGVWPGKWHRAGPHGEGDEPKPMMNEREKSDPAVVAAKSTNEAGQPGEEWMEPRAGPREMWTGKARSEHRIGQACHKRWAAPRPTCTLRNPPGPSITSPDSGSVATMFTISVRSPY